MDADYEVLEEGFVMVRPEIYGWQHIGRGDYAFSELIIRYGHECLSRHDCAPPNFREVTEQEIAQMHKYTSLPWIATTFRDIAADSDGVRLGETLSGHLYLNHTGKGLMITFNYFQQTVRYFVFELCVHEYKTTRQSLTYQKRTCVKCGYTKEIK